MHCYLTEADKKGQILADRGSTTVHGCGQCPPTMAEFVTAEHAAKGGLRCRCDQSEEEDQVERDSRIGGQEGAKLLYVPAEQPKMPRGTKCFKTGKRARVWACWGRALAAAPVAVPA